MACLRLNFFLYRKDLFTEENPPRIFHYFLRRCFYVMVFCSKNSWGTFNKLPWIFFFCTAARLMRIHVSSCGPLLEKSFLCLTLTSYGVTSLIVVYMRCILEQTPIFNKYSNLTEQRLPFFLIHKHFLSSSYANHKLEYRTGESPVA